MKLPVEFTEKMRGLLGDDEYPVFIARSGKRSSPIACGSIPPK